MVKILLFLIFKAYELFMVDDEDDEEDGYYASFSALSVNSNFLSFNINVV